MSDEPTIEQDIAQLGDLADIGKGEETGEKGEE